MLLEAYASLAAHERLPLILAGGKGWDYAPILAAVEAYNLTNEVHLPGFIPDAEMPLWYNSADVFVYPSVFEGFGLPVLEAMACGTPVVTSDVSSLPEVAQTAGLCLPPHDPTVWTNALRHQAHDASWRDHARTTGLQVASQYRWETTAQQTIDSYQRALGASNA
jgi:glycosyltransferase involved in cell wall biosynthesis